MAYGLVFVIQIVYRCFLLICLAHLIFSFVSTFHFACLCGIFLENFVAIFLIRSFKD
jgi:hypothetical protein